MSDRAEMIDALWNVFHAVGSTKAQFERSVRRMEANGETVPDHLKVVLYDTQKAYEEITLLVSRFVTTNA